MTDAARHLRDTLIGLYGEIERTRMQDMPIVNDALSVNAFGFEVCDSYRPGVLLTPWFMSLLLIPEDGRMLEGLNVGDKKSVALPAGQFQFIVGHEDGIGAYLSCSLFSPVFEFCDQETAEITAQAVLDQVLIAPQKNVPDADADMRAIWEGRVPVEPEGADFSENNQPEQDMPSSLNRRELLCGLRRGPAGTEDSGKEVRS